MTLSLPRFRHSTPRVEQSPQVVAPPAEPLAMFYTDVKGRPEHAQDDPIGLKTYRPAELIFANARSHKLAAKLVKALGEQSGLAKEMHTRHEQQDDPVVDPISLPSTIHPDNAPDIIDGDYNWRRYELEEARQIRRSIGTAAMFHEIPELRPAGIDAELAKDAYELHQAAPNLGEYPRNEKEEYLEMATRPVLTAEAIRVENEMARFVAGE